ncbi:MAG: hypothetical protein Q4B22_03555 [Eubacteriales bacterium]|nr:hypothetical protein [Eubacteriales bacterium]
MLQIEEVLTRSQLKKFVDYPNQLYRNVPQFVPATYADDLEDWDREKNPAFAYCEARCWLAVRNNEIVGRIGAIISHRANEKWNTNRMRFTQVDFIDDKEVSAALFGVAEAWAKEKGCDEIHGPLGFTDMDREGMLVDGFEHRSMFITYYNHPYYIEHLTKLGYVKDVDWIENLLTIPKDDDVCKRLKRFSDLSLRRYHLHLAEAKHQKDFIPLIPAFFRLVNLCYSPLYSTVELSEEQISRYAKKFAPLINPKLSAFVMDENNEMIAMGVGAPSLASALQKSHGKYLPFGWARMLKALYVNDTIDLLLIGVHPDYQAKGVNAIVMNKLLEGCHAMGITKAETGPTLELNSKVLSQWKGFDKLQHKRRRCFIKKLQ